MRSLRLSPKTVLEKIKLLPDGTSLDSARYTTVSMQKKVPISDDLWLIRSPVIQKPVQTKNYIFIVVAGRRENGFKYRARKVCDLAFRAVVSEGSYVSCDRATRRPIVSHKAHRQIPHYQGQ